MDRPEQQSQLLVIMGVVGSGKSTIATALSRSHDLPMIEGDSFHSKENREKMASGIALTNADRMPWLDAIAQFVNASPEGPVLLACSALNEEVRARIVMGVDRPCRWIFLDVPHNLLAERLEKRTGHFMPPSLLASQLETLEIPGDVIRIDGTRAPSEICIEIVAALGRDFIRMDMQKAQHQNRSGR